MRDMHARRIVLVSLVGFYLTTIPASAQTAQGWEFQWEQLRMDVKGADEHAGDVTKISHVQTFSTPPQITDRVTHSPIDLNMGAKNAFRAELKHRGPRFGAGVGGWFLRTADSVSGHVSSSADVRTPTSLSYEVNTVLMWNELVSGIQNDLEPSGMSPVDFHVSGRLRTFGADAFALAALSATDATRLDLIVGGKVARVRTGQDQDMQLRAFVLNAFRPQHLNNNISLASTGAAKVDGVGPMVGLAGRTTWRRLRLDASMTESLVYGSADQSGTFSDIDAVTLAQGPAGPFNPCPLALAPAGCYSVRSDWDFARSEKVLIPVTELQVKVLVDLTRHVAVGASSFNSLWSSVPAPPSFTMTHSDAGPGLDWEFGQRSLRFGSAGLVVSVGF